MKQDRISVSVRADIIRLDCRLGLLLSNFASLSEAIAAASRFASHSLFIIVSFGRVGWELAYTFAKHKTAML
jgi:hypothetical protein